MRRWIIALVGVGGVACVVAWSPWRRDPKQDIVVEDTIARLNSRVEALQRELRARQTLPATVAETVDVERTPVASTAPGMQAADEPPLTLEERAERGTQELEERFHEEPQDRAWSAEMTAQIKSSLAESLPAAGVLEASCAQSLCKVVLRHESAEDQRKLGYTLGSVGPFRNGVYYDYDFESRPPRTTLYVMRQGQSTAAQRRAL